MFENIIHLILMPCRKATVYIERQQAGDISWLQKARLQAHLRICTYCRAYEQKAHLIDQWMKKKLEDSIPEKFHKTEAEVFIIKIKEKLKI